jgi:hypothetical protein
MTSLSHLQLWSTSSIGLLKCLFSSSVCFLSHNLRCQFSPSSLALLHLNMHAQVDLQSIELPVVKKLSTLKEDEWRILNFSIKERNRA